METSISTRANSSLDMDKIEAKALKKVFGKSLDRIPASSIKSMLGETISASSVLQAASCVGAMRRGVIPPTVNYKTKDPECDIDCVPNKSRSHKAQVVLNNSQAFGGNNACLVVGSL